MIVSANVVEGRGEGGIGAVEGELILSACVVEDRGEGGWERKTYHAGEASASADRRMKQNAARGNARNPPSRQRFLHPLLAPPHGISSAGEALGSASTPADKAARRCGRTAESAREDAAVRTKQKPMAQLCFEKRNVGGAVN